ncbi:MAG: MBL fold metallo-hydrolase [Eubacterium sp.]|nr:MBL fold metallo-hydrolase [Eubacterium sp.]MDD7208729.1 MBL fold metallo-hydrolase [Lachnospiraceae bacterium]MDY5497756.1 MBL fold metallo-hydrolase [Anaerobutyricum sp.]
MNLASIASGSSGNCIYIGNDHAHFLVDAGISRKRIVEGLSQMEIDPGMIQGILVTHEHMDHIAGLGVFLRKYPVPVFATGKTIDAILKTPSLGKVNPDLFESIAPDQPFLIDDARIEASRIYHDAADPVCYTISDQKSKVGVATDFGTYDDYLVEKMQGCETLLVESNHDLNMLMVGPYPYPLKRRIMGNRGHLSNERAGQFLSKVIGKNCRHILLGHLSKENNYGELAYETVKVELMLHNLNPDEADFSLQVASRTTPTYVI